MIPRSLGRALERGRLTPLAPIAALWAQGVARRLGDRTPLSTLPSWGVFGATRGGSFRTPVALELVRRLQRDGARPVLVGHGYGARLRAPRVVHPDDALHDVGDEALLAARSLDAPVVVGPDRAQAARLAASLGDAIVLDGSHRATHRVLSVDAAAPWGSGVLFPAGDLVATQTALLAAATAVARVRAEARVPDLACEVAVVTLVARPARFVRALSALRVTRVVELEDHGGGDVGARVASALAGARFDVVLCTEKCAVSLPGRILGRPVLPVPMVTRFELEPVACLRDGAPAAAGGDARG